MYIYFSLLILTAVNINQPKLIGEPKKCQTLCTISRQFLTEEIQGLFNHHWNPTQGNVIAGFHIFLRTTASTFKNYWLSILINGNKNKLFHDHKSLNHNTHNNNRNHMNRIRSFLYRFYPCQFTTVSKSSSLIPTHCKI